MTLAIFDLDNTLLNGDSDHAWGNFLVEQSIVDADEYRQANDQFYQDYLNGKLNIDSFLSFSLKPLAENSLATLTRLHAKFMQEKVLPMRLEKADELLNKHRQQGDYLLIITATNRFITEPIAELLAVDHILATEPEFDGQNYTGKIIHPPCFQEGKIYHLQQWLNNNPQHSLNNSYFYSDSYNDLPLLELVDHPIAVNPDDKLSAHALAHRWPILDLRV